ncbi:MAG: YlxM family DNA-binding protein [Erysipelotrichaceae bacterium]
MSNFFEANELLDFYENLLTASQKKIMNYYFREDFSLTEIAELLNISRSAVSDSLRKSQRSLNNYEEKLSLVEKHHTRMDSFKNYPSEICEKLLEIERGKENV